MVINQVRREDCRRDMNATGRRILLEHLREVTKRLVPDVYLTNRSTKGRLDLKAEVHGDCLYVARSQAEKLVFAAGDTIDLPYHPRHKLNPEVEAYLTKLIEERLPRMRDRHRLNQGLPRAARAFRNEDGIQLTIEGLSDKGFARVVEGLRQLIDHDRFHREDPI